LASPIQEAFNKIIEEIYWIEDLDEAERVLSSHLEAMDEDLREILLEERRKICSDPEVVLNIVRLEVLADSTDNRNLREALLLKSLIEMLFLVQCSPKWARMGPREKARVLTPLYKAWHGLKLAMKNYPENIDKLHLSVAFTMAELAYERADREGLVSDIYRHIERMSEKLLQEEGRGDSPEGGDDRRA